LSDGSSRKLAVGKKIRKLFNGGGRQRNNCQTNSGDRYNSIQIPGLVSNWLNKGTNSGGSDKEASPIN
jgi:hypothetical protein